MNGIDFFQRPYSLSLKIHASIIKNFTILTFSFFLINIVKLKNVTYKHSLQLLVKIDLLNVTEYAWLFRMSCILPPPSLLILFFLKWVPIQVLWSLSRCWWMCPRDQIILRHHSCLLLFASSEYFTATALLPARGGSCFHMLSLQRCQFIFGQHGCPLMSFGSCCCFFHWYCHWESWDKAEHGIFSTRVFVLFAFGINCSYQNSIERLKKSQAQ